MDGTSKSALAFALANRYIPGGVNSPVRAWKAVGGEPFFVDRGEGPFIFDLDGRRYVDLIMAYGPLILGHRHQRVVEALERQIRRGISYGMPTEEEARLAQIICEAIPSVEKVRLVNSGTEATMSAIRVARGFTGREKVVKFAGCYHGHADYLLVKAGSGATTFGSPDSAGVPADFAKHTVVLPFNDAKALRDAFSQWGKEIACVIVEPIVGNMGVVWPTEEFVEALRDVPRTYGALLVLDEVMTGFRVSWAGAQGLLGLKPDLTCLGKVIGGGLPVGAYGGRADIMEKVAPLGPVYQAGTLSGNPLSVAAGIATLEVLKESDPYPALDALGERLCQGLKEAAKEAKVPVSVQRAGSMFTVFFSEREVRNLEDAMACNLRAFRAFFHEMMRQGVALPPSQFEAAFLSTAHSEAEIGAVIEASRHAFRAAKEVQ